MAACLTIPTHKSSFLTVSPTFLVGSPQKGRPLVTDIVTTHYHQSQAQRKYGCHRPYFDGTHRMSRHRHPGVTYTYKGKAKPVYLMSEPLDEVCDELNDLMGADLNYAVVNYYLSARASPYPHTDVKYIPQLGKRPVIAAVSFGASRDFELIKMDKSDKIIMPLNHGDLFVMHGDSQLQWKHGISEVPEDQYNGSHVSLTFRHHPIQNAAVS